MRQLSRIESKSELEFGDTIESLEQVSSLVANAKKNTMDMISSLNFESHILEEVEDRLYKLKDLSRKYNVTTDKLTDLVEDFSKKLSESDDLADMTKKSALRIKQLENDYDIAANKLSEKRLVAAAQ